MKFLLLLLLSAFLGNSVQLVHQPNCITFKTQMQDYDHSVLVNGGKTDYSVGLRDGQKMIQGIDDGRIYNVQVFSREHDRYLASYSSGTAQAKCSSVCTLTPGQWGCSSLNCVEPDLE